MRFLSWVGQLPFILQGFLYSLVNSPLLKPCVYTHARAHTHTPYPPLPVSLSRCWLQAPVTAVLRSKRSNCDLGLFSSVYAFVCLPNWTVFSMQAGRLLGPGPLGTSENVRFFHSRTEQWTLGMEHCFWGNYTWKGFGGEPPSNANCFIRKMLGHLLAASTWICHYLFGASVPYA